MADLECVWNMGTPCDGKIGEEDMFDAQIRVPICEIHIKQHRDILTLHKNGYDIEEVLQMSAEDRRREVLTIGLSAIDDIENVDQ